MDSNRMQNKNRKFWCSVLSFFLFFGIVAAQEEAVVTETEQISAEVNKSLRIRTNTIRPMVMSFFESDSNSQIVGEVFFPEIEKADRLVLEAFDSGQSKIYDETFEVDLLESASQKFKLQVPNYGLPAGSRMEAVLYDQERAVGRVTRTLPQVDQQTIYRISRPRFVPGEQSTSINLDFENGGQAALVVQPQIKVWQQSVTPEALVTREFFEAKTVEGKSRETLVHSFVTPARPGLYRVEVVALDDNKKILSGALESFFVVDGDFAAFVGSFINPIPGEEKGLEIRLVGDYEGDESNLTLQVQTQLFGANERVLDRLNQSVSVPVIQGSFAQKIILNGDTESLEKVEVKATLKNSSNEVLAELIDAKQFAKKEAVLEEAVSEAVVKSGDTQWWLIGAGVVAALLFFVFVIWFVRKKKKVRQFCWIICALWIGTFSSAQAALEVFWHHPVPNWYFNPDATGEFEDFSIMKFQGNIFNTLTQKGFFYTVPEQIVVGFFKDLSYDVDGARICTDCFYARADMSTAVQDATCVNEDDYVGLEAEICDNKTYRFEVDLTTVPTDEGEWGIQVLFKLDGVWFGTNWAEEDGTWYRIYFDKTEPVIPGDITYDGGEAPLGGDLVFERRPDILNGVGGATGLVGLNQALAASQAELEAKKQRRSELEAIALSKIHERNHLVLSVLQDLEFTLAQTPIDEQAPVQAAIAEKKILLNALTQNAAFSGEGTVPDADLGINDVAVLLGNLSPALTRTSTTAINEDQILLDTTSMTALALDPPDEGLLSEILSIGNTIGANQADIVTQRGLLEGVSEVHKNTPVSVGIVCEDPELEAGVPGAGCNASALEAAVRGNFCEYGEVCETSTASQYAVCDQVGNCTGNVAVSARLDWYDPVPPTATNFDVIKNKDDIGGVERVLTGNVGADNVFAADDRIAIEVEGEDDLTLHNITNNPSLYDPHACGSTSSSAFFRRDVNDDFCTQATVRCPISSSKRGQRFREEACLGDCPTGFALQGDLCVPFCDFRLFNGCFPFLLIGDECTVTAWTPDAATVNFGDPFTQVNNCGQTRQASGTKSITGTLNHFLDGKEVFGAYLYDTTEDTLPINSVLDVDIDGGGTDGFYPFTSLAGFSDPTQEVVNSPSAGRAFKVSTFDVSGVGRYGAWRRDSVSVSPNTNYVLTYWVKTDATLNKDTSGAWISLTGNGSNADVSQQYESTMEGVPGDLKWYKVVIPFTTPAGTTQLDVELRLQEQNSKVAYFDDVKIFEQNWRFDASKSWHSETKDDQDGLCDYIQNASGTVVDGPDDRCGQSRFPEKAVLVYTTDGFYIFDAEKGSFWMKAVKDPSPSTFGRFVFNALESGRTFGLNGNLYLAHRFNEPNSIYDDRNGALEVMDVIGDEMYTHRMSGCYLLAGTKGVGSSFTSNFNCADNGVYNWNGFVNDPISARNITRNPWSNEMPPGQQLATHQINHTSAGVISGKTYVAVATDYGISVLNKTDDTVQHLEWNGYNGDDYNFDFLHPDGSTYHQAHIEADGSMWYKWNYQRSSNDGSRLWKLNSVSSLPFNNGIITGFETASSRIQPLGTSGAYPTTAQDENSTAFDVQGNRFVSGGVVGIERYNGTLVGGNSTAHPGIVKSTINKNYATAPLYGNVLGHWVDSPTDRGDYNNDLANQGAVSSTAVASGADLTQFNFNGSTQYLSTGSEDFNVNGPITFGAWVNTTGSEDGGYIMAKGNSTNLDFAVYRKADNTLRVTGTDVTDIPGFTLNGWDLVVVTFDGANKNTYLNNQLISSVADTRTAFDGSAAAAASGLRGRYVRIDKNNGEALSLAEVQVFDDTNSTNLAVSGTATQINTDHGGSASRAIDGSTNGSYGGGSVTHTDGGNGNRWWEVDLGAEYDLGDIVVWNRTDSCCSARLAGGVVSVLDAGRNVVSTSSALTGSTSAQTLNLTGSSFPPTRYVRLEKTSSGTFPYLYLAEVEVTDLSGSNIAQGSPVDAISEHPSIPADRAVDGNTNGDLFDDYSVFRNNNDSIPSNLWWEVDLGAESLLGDITVWNRTDSRSDYLIGTVVQLLDAARNVVATSNPLSNNTSQNPVFINGDAGSLFIGSSPEDPGASANLFDGAMALPFVAAQAYSLAEIQDIHTQTQHWFASNAKITIQGTSNEVLDVIYGDDDDLFVVTSDGITHFDVNGVVIRTLTESSSSPINTQIISNHINDIDYKNRYLIIAYDDPDGPGGQSARGLEIITIGTEPND